MKHSLNMSHRSADATYREKSQTIKKLLDHLSEQTSTADFLTHRKPDWSDVGSLAYIEARLQELIDFITPADMPAVSDGGGRE